MVAELTRARTNNLPAQSCCRRPAWGLSYKSLQRPQRDLDEVGDAKIVEHPSAAFSSNTAKESHWKAPLVAARYRRGSGACMSRLFSRGDHAEIHAYHTARDFRASKVTFSPATWATARRRRILLYRDPPRLMQKLVQQKRPEETIERIARSLFYVEEQGIDCRPAETLPIPAKSLSICVLPERTQKANLTSREPERPGTGDRVFYPQPECYSRWHTMGPAGFGSPLL